MADNKPNLDRWIFDWIEANAATMLKAAAPFFILGSLVACFAYGWMQELPRSMRALLGPELLGIFFVQITVLMAALTVAVRFAILFSEMSAVILSGKNLEDIRDGKAWKLRLWATKAMTAALVTLIILSFFLGLKLSLHFVVLKVALPLSALLTLLIFAEAFAAKPKEQAMSLGHIKAHIGRFFSEKPYLAGHGVRQICLALAIAITFQELGRFHFLARLEGLASVVCVDHSNCETFRGHIVAQVSGGVYLMLADLSHAPAGREIVFLPNERISELRFDL